MEVGLFITCLTDQFSPRVGVAMCNVLTALGCRVRFAREQTCCGQPFYNNGYHPECLPLARRMIDVLEPFDPVVTPSASCCAMIREHYPKLLADEPEYLIKARDLGERCFEFGDFIVRELGFDGRELTLPRPLKVTHHYTCHSRLLGIGPDAGERLLRSMGNVEFAPLRDVDMCCGFGGTFSLNYAEVSGIMAGEKAACIEETSADVVVCSDAGCSMNISGMLNRRGSGVRVLHLAEFIAEGMGLSCDELSA